jgi:phage terminase Nu1 subunit (DNA packaging protein)
VSNLNPDRLVPFSTAVRPLRWSAASEDSERLRRGVERLRELTGSMNRTRLFLARFQADTDRLAGVFRALGWRPR